jgi:glycosyltransferase involved in cell wall biosynthesis
VSRNRVLIVVQNLPVPFDRRVWLEATTLTQNGYRVSVICPKMRGFNRAREMIEDIDIYRYTLPIDAQGKLGFVLEFLWCFLATALLSLKVQITGRGFDVLHVCNPPETYWPLAWFWRAFGKSFIFDHHDLSPEMFAVKFERPATREGGGVLFKALLFLERMTFNAARIVITTNESHKRIAVERGGKRPEDVFIVRSGPDLSRFKVFEPDLKWRRGKRYLVAYLGEICKQDGVDHLVRAVKILRDELKRTDVHCIFMGGGPHQQAIADYAVEIGVEELCTFTGRVSDEDLCRVLSSADIGVDPDPKNEWSDQSTMNKVIEYMFFGLPVLSYDLHETRVSAGEAGMFVTANDEHALARGIIELLDDPARRKRLGATGFARVREVLAWNYSVAPLLTAYRAALGDRSAAAPSTGTEPASVEAEP